MKASVHCLALVLLVFLNSCMTNLPITRTLPPEIQIDSNITSFQLRNSFDYTLMDFDNNNRNALYKMTIDTIIQNLIVTFENDTNYTLYPYDSIISGKNPTSLPDSLNAATIAGACKVNGAGLLLSIESLDIFYDKEIVYEEDVDGKEIKKAEYYLILKAGISLYDCVSCLPIDRYEFKKEKFIDSRDVIVLNMAFRPSYASRQNEIAEMAQDIGGTYINEFYPSVHKETKSYYSKKEFEALVPLIQNAEWEEAVEFLLPLTKSKKKRISNRAMYNLSVVYYAMEDYEKSGYWFQKSQESKFIKVVDEE